MASDFRWAGTALAPVYRPESSSFCVVALEQHLMT
jgi:hypothetical protein